MDDIKLAGKKHNIDPMWKVLNKEVDLGEPTSFLDHVYLGCTQRQCEISKDIVDNYRTMFESRISAVRTENLPSPQNLRISSWSYDMEGHAKKCVERYCELANNTTQQLYKVSTPCIEDHHFKEEEMKSVGELSHVCSQIVLKCLYLVRIGRPDIQWSVNKLARSITKWTKACDKRLNRLISCIHHTCEYKQYCHVGNTAKQCRLGLFQDSDFAGDIEDSKSTSGGTLCVFGSYTFVPISWMCKKQTAVSHNSTESEIISLDTGLRLDGLPALELWDLIVSVLGNVSRVSDRSGKPESDDHKHHKSHNKIDAMKDMDSVPSNVQSARQEALLYVFEDNEAVIKMIIKGRSPTMRHVSRTHWVALDWLFDRINLDSKIQIKYIDTKNQLADILTKGNFTRDEWNHMLSFFNISHFSSTIRSAAMAKRFQQESGEERVTAKSRPMMNLIARTPSFVSSSTSVSPVKRWYGNQDPGKSIAGEDRSRRPGNETDLFEASDHYYHEQFMESFSSTDYSKLDYDRAWSSQEWKAEATTYDRSGRPDKTSWRMVRKVRPDHEEILLDGIAQSVRYGETLRDRSGRPDNINSQEVANSQNFIMGNDETELELSVESRSFLNRVNDRVRKRQKRISNVAGGGEEHSIIWWTFMAVTMESAVFMGKNFQDNQNSVVNTADLTLKQMFDISAKLVAEQDEISGLETIGWDKHSWKYLSLIDDERIINLQRAKVYVFSDSVLCLGKIHQNPESNEAWKKRIEWITTSQSYRDFDGISEEPTEFEWNIFHRFDTLQLYGKVKDLLSRLGETPETFSGRILIMSMFNDISCETKDNEQECLAHARVVSLYARKFGTGQWSFIGPSSEKKWYSIKEDSPQGIWDHIAEKMLLEFAESTCPIFRATTPLSRGQLRSKGHGKLSIHFAADQETIETIFRIVVSANQLSLYGAVANMCEEYESRHGRSGRLDKVMGQSIVLGEIKTEVLWRMMIQHTKTLYCSNMKNELRGFHNKIK